MALAELIIYPLLFLALALAVTSKAATNALFGWLIALFRPLPIFGGLAADQLERVQRTILSWLDKVERGIDHLAGLSFHVLAKQADWLWDEIKRHAAVIGAATNLVEGLVYAYRHLRGIVHGDHRAIGGHRADIRRMHRELRGIEHRIRHLEHEVGNGIGDDVLPRLRSLDRELAKLEGKVIPGIRSDVAAAENDVTALGRYVAQNFVSVSADSLKAAVAVGLAGLGLGGLRCSSLTDPLKRRGCGWWDDIARLLGIAFIAAEIGSFEELVKDAQAATDAVTRGVMDLLQIDV